MIKIIRFYTLFLFTLLWLNVTAQAKSPADSLKRDTLKKDTLQYRPKSIYLEAGGPGSFYSLNFDIRFNKFANGLGARIGVTYIFVDNENSLAIPFAIYYLFGKKNSHFEVGAGATYFYDFKTDYTPLFGEYPSYSSTTFSQYGSGVVGSFSVGYRYQPVKGGVKIRVGNSLIFKKDFLPLWPYVSVGYSFKNKPKASKVKSR